VCAGGLVKILPAAGAVVAAAPWPVAAVLRSCFAAVAAHWLVADSAAAVSELGLVAAVVVWEPELAAADDAVSELELVAVVVVWELELAAAGAVAVVSVVEPAAAFQA